MIRIFIICMMMTNFFVAAQEGKVIYLPETENLACPDILLKTGLIGKRKVTFDVINLKPVNAIVEKLDSLNFEGIDEKTIGNLDSLVFVNDTTNFSIIFEYLIRENISNNYVEYPYQGLIKAVYRKTNTEIKEYNDYSPGCDCENYSVTRTGYIHTGKDITGKSDILVELTFTDTGTEVKVLRNNLPQLNGEIVDYAKTITKEQFKCDSFTPEKYYLSLKVVRWFGKGDYSKVF